jgi:hypothetical protein
MDESLWTVVEETPQDEGALLTESILQRLVRACPRLEILHTLSTPGLCGAAPPYVLLIHVFLHLLQTMKCLRDVTGVSVSVNALPSAAGQARFGMHSFGPLLTIEHTEVTEELKQIIRIVLPRAKELAVRQTDGQPAKVAL